MAKLQVGLANQAASVGPAELHPLAAALNIQVQHVAVHWPAADAEVIVLDNPKLIPAGVSPIFIVDQIDGGFAGFHRYVRGVPWAMVSAKRDWRLAASHELIELLIDPTGEQITRSRRLDLADGEVKELDDEVDYLLEACDPLEDPAHAYPIGEVTVSDFYTPSYFDRDAQPGVQYSHTGAITRPRQVLPNGYLSWRLPDGSYRQLRNFGAYEIVAIPGGAREATQSTRGFIDQRTPTPRTAEVT